MKRIFLAFSEILGGQQVMTCCCMQEHLETVNLENASQAASAAVAKDAAELLLQKAAEKKSMDNVTALVLLLRWS